METQHFDYIVIGGGSGGYAAARTAREALNRVAIIDGAEHLGGLCILKGCMPSKTLIHSAEILHLARKGNTFGLNIPEAEPDMPALHQRKLRIIKEFADYRQEQLQSNRFTLFRNKAKFINSRTIELDNGQHLTADYFMIATGSVVSVPSLEGLSEVPYWTSDDILELNFRPEKVILLGGGIVACELAQFLNRIGTQVIQIQRSHHILKNMSIEAAEIIEQVFCDEGIQLYTDSKLHSVEYHNAHFTVHFEYKGDRLTMNSPHLINALGRQPATSELGLEAANIDTLPSGHIKCNAWQQTSQPKIYACGDVAGPHEIVHIAIMQGETAARHAIGHPTEPVNYDTLLGVVFTDPQVATIGLSEKQLKESGIEYLVANYPFNDHGKSILMEAKYGYAKVMANKEGIVIGAECVSKDAGELIHSMAVAVSLKANVRDLLKVHWYHPTLSEIWSYPIEEIMNDLSPSL